MKFMHMLAALTLILGLCESRCYAQEHYWVGFTTGDDCHKIFDQNCADLPYVPAAPCDYQDCEPFEGMWACGGQEYRLKAEAQYRILGFSPFDGSTNFESHITGAWYCEESRLCHPDCGEQSKCKVDPDGNWWDELSRYHFPWIRYDGPLTCEPIIT